MKQINIKAVIFDIGRVLVEVNLTNGIFKFLNFSKNETDLKILNKLLDDQAFVKFSKGMITAHEFYTDFISKTGLDFSYENFKFHWQNIFNPIKGMDIVTEELSKKYEIGILSDIDELHWARLKNDLSIFKKVKKPTLSYEVGHMKPEWEIYEIAARNVNQLPVNCLFIDDREMNVKGALDAGMQALHFTSIEKLQQDLSLMGIL